MSNILEIKGLSAGYGPLRVIHDLDLIIQSGERVGIVGLNGHGKTTLFYADTFEKPGSDKYMKEILEAPDYETLTTATQKLYNELHHTDAKKQENERFAKVAMRVGGRVNLT